MLARFVVHCLVADLIFTPQRMLKTAKWIEVLFDVETLGSPKNIVLCGGS